MLIEDFEVALDFFSETLDLALEYKDEVKMLAHFRLQSGQLLMAEMGVEFVTGVETNSLNESFAYFRGPNNHLYALWERGEPASQ